MGVVIRQSVKSTIVLLFGAFLGAVVMLLSTRFLSKEELGFSRNLLSQATIIQQVLSLGIPYTILTFSPRYPEGDERRNVLLSIGILTPVILTLLFCIPYYLLKQHIVAAYLPEEQDMVNRYFYALPVLSVIWSVFMSVNLFLDAQYKIAVAVLNREVISRIWNLVFLFLITFSVISYPQYIFSLSLLYLVPLTGLVLYAVRNIADFKLSFKVHLFSRSDYHELIHFSWFHLLTGISLYFLGVIDPVMLAFYGLGKVAVYTNAVFFSSLLFIPYRAILSSAYTSLNKAYISGHKELELLFKRTSDVLQLIGVIMFTLIACNLHNALALFNQEGYEDMVPLAMIIMLGRLFDMFCGLNNELISISKYYKFNFYNAIFLIVLLISSNLMLIPVWGTFGAAWATTLSLAIFNISKTVFLYYRMKIQPFSKATLQILGIGVITFLAGYHFYTFDNFIVDTFVRSGLIGFLFLVLLYFIKPARDISDFLNKIFLKIPVMNRIKF